MAEAEESFWKKMKLKYDLFGKELREDNRDLYKSVIYVEADEDTLQKIEKVEYTLHKTFREPLVLRTNREEKFSLAILLWGEFTVKAVAFVKDNSNIIEVPMALYLDIFPRKRLEEGKQKIKETLDNPKYRWRALKALVRESGLNKEEVLTICREDENIKESLIPSIRGDRLFRYKHKYLDESILKLKDKRADVRWRAAVALGRIGNHEAVEPLIKALEDEHGPVRYAAIESLGKIKEAVGPLIGKLKDKNPKVRSKATIALGEIGDPKAKDELKKVSSNEDEESYVRSTAEEALKKIEAKQKST